MYLLQCGAVTLHLYRGDVVTIHLLMLSISVPLSELHMLVGVFKM